MKRTRRVPPEAARSAAGIALLALLAGAPHARADGGFMPPIGLDIYEPSQIALLRFDAATQTEDLIVRAQFQGNAHDFGWILPVPSLPTLEIADGMLLYECAQLTAPLYRYREDRGCVSRDSGDLTAPNQDRDGDVTVYEDQALGIYRALTVGASDATVLADSLEAWGYLHIGNRARVLAALQFYVEKSWFFVALKTGTPETEEPSYGYWEGGIDPVHLRFASATPVYPMRISALSATASSEVLIYALAAHRMTFPRAQTAYANRIDADERVAIRRQYPRLAEWIEESTYVTKLRRTFSPASMTDDLVLTPASSDREFRIIHYSGASSTGFLLLAVAGILAARSRRRSAVARNLTEGVS
jgi:hypothetical protein